MGALLAVSLPLGLILLVVPFLVFFHWLMYAPAALAEGRTVAQAVEASRAFARERKTAGFTALVLLVWAAVLLVRFFVLDAVFASGLDAVDVPPSYADATADALAMWVLGPLVPLFPAAYWSLARRAPLPAPTPAAAPHAERARTTKCPQCGALVPYAATGAPVDVTCPECGRRGRVL
jgi:hypothetical protein